MVRHWLAGLGGIALAGSATAQPRAVSVASTHTGHSHAGPEGLGVELAYGPAGQLDGRSGSMWRLEHEVFPIFARGKLGPVVGVQTGFETWSSGADNWGFSMPLAVVAGARAFPFRVLVGGGVDMFLVDQVDDDTGFGMYAPFALAKVGLDIEGIQAGVDARVGYRWQLGADDHGRWQLGMFVAKTFSPPPRKRMHVATDRMVGVSGVRGSR